MGKRLRKLHLVSSVSTLSLMILGNAALAQDGSNQDIPTDLGDGEFLGIIELSQSKRSIDTESAIANTTINQEEIDDRQAGTIGQLIDSVPGVTLVNGNRPQGSGLNIRGFGATGSYGSDQKVQIHIDGATTGSEELYRIGTQLFTDPELYKEVQVIRGTAGTFEYGSGIIGGLVMLETKDASDFTNGEVGLRFRQTLAASSNAQGFATSSILAWQPTENLEFLANYTLRDTDEYKNGDGVRLENTDSRMPSFLGKMKYTFGDDSQHSITASYNDSEVDEQDVLYDAIGVAAAMFGRVDRKVTDRKAGLRYQWSPVNNDLINLDVSLTQSDQHIDSTYIDGSSPLEGTGSEATVRALGNADHDYEITKLTAKNTMFFTTGALSHDLRIGVEVMQKERLAAPSAPGGKDDRVAVFAVNDISFGNQFTLSPAVRFETQDITSADGSQSFDNSALMGGISARYEFQSGFALFASASYTENLPILDDFGNDAYLQQSEKARTLEIGASYVTDSLFSENDSLRAKVNIYDTNLWDVTSYSSTVPGAPSATPLMKTDTSGVEIEASYSTGSGIYADFNAAFGDQWEYNSAGTKSIWRNAPADNARLTLGKRFGETWDVSWELVAAKSHTNSAGTKSSGYGISNLRATYRPQTGFAEGAEIRFGVENLFDKNYKPVLASRDAEGRNFKLSLAKTF